MTRRVNDMLYRNGMIQSFEWRKMLFSFARMLQTDKLRRVNAGMLLRRSKTNWKV